MNREIFRFVWIYILNMEEIQVDEILYVLYGVIGIGIVGLWVDSTRRMYVHNGDGVCSIRFNPIC